MRELGWDVCQGPLLLCTPTAPRGIHHRLHALHCIAAHTVVGAADRGGTPAAEDGSRSARGAADSGRSRSGASRDGGGGHPASATPRNSRADLSYRDALAGGAGRAPGLEDMRSPRTPGGSHVPVTVSRNAAATSGHHSPTILAQTGYTSRQDPFTSPLQPQDQAGGTAASAGPVPRKISFFSSSPKPGAPRNATSEQAKVRRAAGAAGAVAVAAAAHGGWP